MKCKQCGNDVAAGSAFCPACGAALAAAAAPPTPPQQKLHPAGARAGGGPDAEVTVWEGRFSYLAMIGSWVSAGLLTAAIIVAGLLVPFDGSMWTGAAIIIATVWIALILRLVFLQLTVRYTMTTQRLLHEHGLLWRQTDRIEAIDIDDVTVTQGPIARMVGVGNVKIISSDQSTPVFHLNGIDDVRKVANQIDDIRRKERRKRAVHIESV